MAAPAYHDPTPTVGQTHNTSSQYHVRPNPDPALDLSHEHRHQHLHHDAFAEKGREDEVVYSKGTTFEKSTIPDESPLDHELHRRYHPGKGEVEVGDTEKGISPVRYQEEDLQTHSFSNFYAKYRIFFHLFIWLLFTGYVLHSSCERDTESMEDYVWSPLLLGHPQYWPWRLFPRS